jgi:hypothetical protein
MIKAATTKHGHGWVLFSIVLFIFSVWLLWGRCAPLLLTNDYGKAGQFGDMFGALNTFFTGLALAGVVYSIREQRRQLEIAEKELKEASITAEQQRFEGTFFQLLSLLTGIVESMAGNQFWGAGVAPGVKSGREVLNSMSAGLLEQITVTQTDMEPPERRKYLEKRYRMFYERYSTILAHYFRVLYRILRHIESANIEDKQKYAKIVRAQLSTQELVLLFYNSFIPEGHKMQRLVEMYALLKHIPLDRLAQPGDRKLYSEDAYNDKPGP